MSTTQFSFQAKVRVGEQIVPIKSELVLGDSQSQDGVENGFLFMLDLQPGDDPVTVNLGDIIRFVEEKLGVGEGALSKNGGLATLTDEFGNEVASPTTFNSSNDTLVNIREFTVNSTTSKFLFSINIDIEGSDPSKGLIALPGELANWVKIKSVSIAFKTQTDKTTNT
ncbi:MAG: hypothetical protein H6585_02535 [Flavobacteriales bacterium]|nr:hypothetical protein [Flavobacteriales bacterium]MCB9447206.1 hypothetical protein [Flavobacteriales bacterium]